MGRQADLLSGFIVAIAVYQGFTAGRLHVCWRFDGMPILLLQEEI